MNILNKYLYRVIVEKKGRMFLLLFSIVISTALLILSLATIDLITEMYVDQAKKEYGSYNVQIKSSNGDLFNYEDLIIDDSNSKKMTMIESNGYVADSQEKEFKVLGIDKEELDNFDCMNEIVSKNEEFKDKKVIISKKTKKELNVELGEKISLCINGQKAEYEVTSIYEKEGLFCNDGEENFTVIIPKENAESYLNEKEKISLVFLAVKSNDINKWIENFNINNDNLNVIASKTYDEEVIYSQLEWIQQPMIFMLIITLLMTAFIIISAFNLIISERIKVMGTFLSQGATNGQIMRLLVKEGIIYGIIGGIIGLILGTFMTKFISNYSVYGFSFSKYENYSISKVYLLIGFIFAIIFSGITVIISVSKISKISIKDIILDKVKEQDMKKSKSYVVGIILILIVCILNAFEKKVDYIFSIPCICIYIIAAILVISFLVKAICVPIAKFFKGRQVIGMLAFKNLSTSNIMCGNITLISVCIMSIVIISSLSNSIIEVINGSFEKMNFDICVVSNYSNSEKVNEKINEEFGDNDVYKVGIVSANLDNDILKPINLYYVEPKKYGGFDDYMYYENKDKQLSELEEEDSGIIICKRVAKNYGIKEGEEISLTVNNKIIKLKVTSIVDPKMYASGNYNIISNKTASEILGYKYSNIYYLKTDLDKEQVKEKLKGLGVEVQDKNDKIEEASSEMKQFVDILSVFSYITIIVGGFGIISNVSISFLQRKKSIAILTSLGMNTKLKSSLLVLESIIMGSIGYIIGIIFGKFSLVLIKPVFKFLMLDLDLTFPITTMALIGILIIIMMVIISLPSIIKCKHMDIVKELKYE